MQKSDLYIIEPSARPAANWAATTYETRSAPVPFPPHCSKKRFSPKSFFCFYYNSALDQSQIPLAPENPKRALAYNLRNYIQEPFDMEIAGCNAGREALAGGPLKYGLI
ncbi:MAG: hypothetical protein M0033_03325 [Nitrospiraceae bacterium]|nr:hypothetical protein [Nitrospiraceae bacterium]